MEIELSSWRAFARSTSLTREERALPPLITRRAAVQDRTRRGGKGFVSACGDGHAGGGGGWTGGVGSSSGSWTRT